MPVRGEVTGRDDCSNGRSKGEFEGRYRLSILAHWRCLGSFHSPLIYVACGDVRGLLFSAKHLLLEAKRVAGPDWSEGSQPHARLM